MLTSDVEWDPIIMDNKLELEQCLDAQMELDNLLGVNDYSDLTFDDQGYYRGVTIYQFNDSYQCTSEFCDLEDIVNHIEHKYHVNPHEVSHDDPDFEALRPNFTWVPVEVINRTFNVTT